jgi:thymidylate kinase
MAKHTQIIDLYGIPACGKTTLAKYMANHPKNGLKVATMRDCVHSAYNNKWKLVKSVSLKNFGESIRLKLSAPLDKKRRVIPFKAILLMGVFKNYVRKYTDYDIVVSAHGDIQSFVSLERGDNLHESPKFKEACLHYLNVSLSTVYVYCLIDARTALGRMNNRSRNIGRIDLISDQDFKLQELERERERFDFWTTILKERNASLIELDMRDSVPSIADKLYAFLINQQLSNAITYD